jgi:hypothetical protein
MVLLKTVDEVLLAVVARRWRSRGKRMTAAKEVVAKASDAERSKNLETIIDQQLEKVKEG